MHTIEFVVVKNPRGTVIKHRKDGTVLVRVECTQQEMDNAIKEMAKRKQNKNK